MNFLEEGRRKKKEERRKKKEGKTEGLKKWMAIVNDRPLPVYKTQGIDCFSQFL
ncbi:MAG: DUF4207 domain-containing protein [Okeania sp. SIO2B3]|nr:DUF4207 domain-containing protein [Okeania sp. SIO2B3]